MTGPDDGQGDGGAAEPTELLAVCVCTYHRPLGLARLLDALAALVAVEGTRLLVVVCDNDEDAGAQAQVEAVRAHFPLELRYVHQPRKGIAGARNAAIAAAGEVDAVLFVDDDEWPEPTWVRELVSVRRATGADIVTGTVLPRFDEPPPAWAVRGGFFERERLPTGTRLHYARTSNVLVSAAVITTSGLRFRQTSSGGGEDTLFFQQAVERGHVIVWADEATVWESVPSSRVNPRWLVARSYRYGLTRSELLRLSPHSALRRVRRAALGLLTVLAAVGKAVPAALGDRAVQVAVAQQAALGCGLMAGAVGASYDDYRVVHGS